MSTLGALKSAWDSVQTLGSRAADGLGYLGTKVRENVGHGLSTLADYAQQGADIASQLTDGIGTAIHPYAGRAFGAVVQGIQSSAPVVRAAGHLLASRNYGHAIENAQILNGALNRFGGKGGEEGAVIVERGGRKHK